MIFSEANIEHLKSGGILTLTNLHAVTHFSEFVDGNGYIIVPNNKQGHAVCKKDGLEIIQVGNLIDGHMRVQLYSSYLEKLEFSTKSKDLERWGYVRESE